MIKVKKSKVAAVVATMAIQLCVGVAYIWSVFQGGIATSLFDGDNAAAGLAYSLLIMFLSIGSLIGGILIQRISLSKLVIAGGVLMFAGFFLASFATAETNYLVWLGYGVIGGVGMGFVYSPTISATQSLYPDRRGFVTGLIVACLGVGGLIFTPAVESLVAMNGGVGVGELPTIRVLSYVFLVMCVVCSAFMITPERKVASGDAGKESSLAVIKKFDFYLVAGAMMLACVGGLMMIGFAKPIAVGRGMADTATMGVLMISVFNAFGRLVWGVVSDKIGRYNTLMLLTVGSAVLTLLVGMADGLLIYAFIGGIGFFYGGFFSTFPTLTAEVLGAENMAINYGYVLIGFGIGGIISSNVGGHYINLAANNIDLMFPAFVIAASCAIAAFVMILVLKKRSIRLK